MLRINNLNFFYEDKQILNNFSLSLLDNDCICIMGKSGIGKTSIIRLILGLENKYSGSIDNSFSNISICFQEPRLFNTLSVLDNLRLIDDDINNIKDILDKLLILDCIDKKISNLSGGQKQRVSIARALLYKADLYIFDEPFTGLDNNTKEIIKKYIKEYLESNNKASLFVLHDSKDYKYFTNNIINL